MSPYVWFTISVYEKLKTLPSAERLTDETLCFVAWLAVQDFTKGEIHKKVLAAPESLITKAVEFAQEKWVERKLQLMEMPPINLSDYIDLVI